MKFDSVAKLAKCPDHPRRADLLGLFTHCRPPFLVANAFIQNHPDQLTEAMRNRPDGLVVAETGNETTVENLEDTTSAPFRSLNIHQQEPARQRARELANTPQFARAQRQRKKVEALFAELKNQIGLLTMSGMNGQWIGDFSGSTTGSIIVNIDERAGY